MKFTLHIWRQENARAKGHFETYEIDNISADCSFLEMLDQLNEKLVNDHITHPVCFDNDCREGICGMCGLYINGRPHGNDDGVTTCQLHMRHFHDGDEIWVEPWRAKAFPIIRDLVVDRTAFDKIIQAGGYISATTGGVPDANNILVPKHKADQAMDAAACIGCGACVAACKNASAMLFVGAKVSHLALLPPRQARGAGPRQEDGLQDGRTRLRLLHQHLRLRSRMPQANQAPEHRPPQQAMDWLPLRPRPQQLTAPPHNKTRAYRHRYAFVRLFMLHNVKARLPLPYSSAIRCSIPCIQKCFLLVDAAHGGFCDSTKSRCRKRRQ